MRPRLLTIAFSLLLVSLACSLQNPGNLPVQPNQENPYYLVTEIPRPTRTPFRPAGGLTVEKPNLSTPTATSLPLLTSDIPTWTLSPVPSHTPTLAASFTPFPTFTPVPTDTPIRPTVEVPAVQRPTYNINLYWDYAGHTATVSQEIIYPNQTGAALTEIILVVNPNLWSGVFALGHLSVNDQPSTSYQLAGQWLTLRLPAPLEAGKSIRLGLLYTLTLPYSAARYENFGWNERQSSLLDWYPFVPAYLPGEGWMVRAPWYFGENLAYPLSDIYVGITFADPASRPVVAASAQPVEENGVLRYAFPGARTFSLSASHDFVVSTAKAGDVTILSYYFPEHATAGERILLSTQQAVQTFSAAFGAYPHKSLSIVETRLNDGLESDGLYFLASTFYDVYDGGSLNNLVLIGVHEVAHEWWYAAVASDQAMEPWLDEALATYSERVFYEYNHPELVSSWYNSRIYYYKPTGYVDMRLYASTSFRTYVNAVYLRGALFLDELRSRMGDEAFFNFMRDYYARHRGHFATADTFFTVLNDHTTDYQDIVQNYFYYR